MKERLKDVKFWVSVGSAILLILSFLTDNFGIEEEIFVEIYSCILALLTTLGVLTKGGEDKQCDENIEQIKEEIKDCLEKNSREEK